MSRPASPFARYIQVENHPRNAYVTAANTARFVPAAEAGNFKKKAGYTSLMNTVITISSGHEVLVMDNLENRHAGQPNYRKMKDLIAHALGRAGVRNSDVNLIVIPNIDNANTRTAIRTFQRDESWEVGTWIATSSAHSTTILNTDLGRTARSVAGKLGKRIGAIYVGEIFGQPTLAFALASGTPPPATYPPSRPASAQRQANPRLPTPVRRNKSGCGCVIC